ncbi:KAP family P-loop NTPase fold protein [Croceicoccus marinus]|uniref:AAA family ATPase n=1 Tax=Croceicoccus marinus TaxID=450378 RepID=A0A7G6VS91_9SPHN|nr:P-loop NTPase fold protein [Croceicoccus marinus]QNE04606.1 AAA family ATPase [Croceicoccus marinus]
MGHADLAQGLDNLFSSLDHGSVAILDGRWGVGKSTFIDRWCAHAEREGFGVIKLDAFAYDYMGEPFDALSAAILAKVSEKIGAEDPRYKAFRRSAVDVSKRLAISSAKAVVRIGTAGLVDDRLIESMAEPITSSSGEFAEKAIESVLERQSKDQASFEVFRTKLSELYEFLSGDDEEKPVIFVVDELDRCRPDFALGILECLKHFFRAHKLHFVLVTNKAILRKSIDNRYGIGDASDDYLQKFYDFTIHFERKGRHSNENAAAKYARDVISQTVGGRTADAHLSELMRLTSQLCIAYDLTFRDVEHVASNISLAYLAISDRQFQPEIFIVVLAYLKAKHSAHYQKVKNRDLTWPEMEKILDQGVWSENFYIERIKDVFRYSLDPHIDMNDPKFSGLNNGRYHLERLEELAYVANSVLDAFAR